MVTQRPTSARDSEIGLPTSRVTACANSSCRAPMAVPQLYSNSARAGPVRLRHASNALAAAATALSTSSGAPRGTSAITSDLLDGLRSGTQSSDALGCHCPAINCRRRDGFAAVGVMDGLGKENSDQRGEAPKGGASWNIIGPRDYRQWRLARIL